MKTVSCDICGRTPEQMSRDGLVPANVYEFKTRLFGCGKRIAGKGTFYICERCLCKIERSANEEVCDEDR